MRNFMLSAAICCLLHGPAYAVTDLPFPNLGTTTPVQPEQDEFTFAVIGDYRPARRDIPYPRAFLRMLDEIKTIRPALVLSAGDAYYGYGGTFQRFKNEIARFLNAVKQIEIPFYNAIGNHEVTDDPERITYVTELYGRLYGSFDVGSSHFIALNTEEKGRDGTIAGEQLAWLRKDLEANKTARALFVILHRPLFSAEGESFQDNADRNALHELFKRYKVTAVFEGHEHLFDDRVKDGVRYMIVGGGGAPLSTSAEEGGFYQYLMVGVNGKNVTIDVIAPEALEMRTISGNDGFEPRAELEVVNISHANLTVNNLSFLMPAAPAGRFRASAVSMDNYGRKSGHAARIGGVRDNGDGTASVSVGTAIPRNGYLRVAVETDPDK